MFVRPQMKTYPPGDIAQFGYPLPELSDPREQLAYRLPAWMQPAITWVSGKALPGQQPVMPYLCTPTAKIFVAAVTVGVGLALGVDAVAVLA